MLTATAACVSTENIVGWMDTHDRLLGQNMTVPQLFISRCLKSPHGGVKGVLLPVGQCIAPMLKTKTPKL